MGKLDRRLVGDTYKAAYEWDIVEPPPIVVFYPPEVAKEMEKAIAIDIERAKAENILKGTLKTAAHDAVIEGMKETLGQ